jgi:hypothetical protein
MATTKGIYTTNRTYVALLRGTYAYVETYITDPFFSYNSLLLSGDTTAIPFNADASTNKFNISVAGDAKAANFSPYTSGYYSNSFDGTGDYLSLPSNAAFAFGTGAYTMEGWIYITAAPTYVSTMFEAGGATNGISLGVAASGAVNIGKYGIGTVISSSAGDVPSNQWVHVAAVRASTATNDTKIYVNGVLKATGTDNNDWTVITSPTVGGIAVAGYVTNGYISNLRVVKGVAVYTAAFTPPTAPLTAVTNTSLLTCQENRFIDDSPNNFTITKNGDVSIKSFNPFLTPSAVTVNNFYSTNFDGSGDYLNAPSNAAFDFGTGDFTVELWANFNSVASVQTLVTNYNGASSGWGFQWRSDVSVLRWAFGDPAIIDYSYTPSLNTWNHFAVSRSGTSLRMFVNGVHVGSATDTTNYSSAQSLSIGALYYAGYIQNFAGSISNFRIVKGTAVYTGAFTPSTTPLSAITNTSLLTCQSSTSIDNSTNNFAITSAGQAQPIPVSPFTQTTTAVNTTYLGSGYFDGTGDWLTTASASTSFNLGAGDFTIECWVYPTSAEFQYGKNLIGNTQDGTVTGWALSIQRSIGTHGIFLGLNNAIVISSGATTVTVNAWNHIAVVRSGAGSDNLKIYLNGVSVATATLSTNDTTNTAMSIGGDDSAAPYNLVGYLSNARFVKGTALYTANFAPPLTPLTAVTNTSLLTLQNSQPHNNSTFLDNSSNKFLITRNGNTTQGTFSPYGGNWSNYFDGTGDYLSVPDNVAFTMGAGDFTLECWVYLSSVAQQIFIGTCDAAGNQGSMSFVLGLDGSSYPFIGVGYAGTVYKSTFGTVASIGRWYHIAGVRNGSMVNVYVDGVKGPNLDMGVLAITDSTEIVAVGRNGAGNFEYVTGYISNVRIVKGTAVYTAAFTPPTSPLTAISGTSLLTCQDNRLIDDSPNNFTITKAGDVSVQKFSPFSPIITTLTTYSAYFDGTGDYLTVPSTDVFAFGTGAYTIEAWVYVTSRSLEASIWATGANNNNFLITTGGLLRLYNGTSYTGTTVIPLNTWAHVAVVRTSTASNGTQLFVNGVSDLVFTDTTNQTSATTGVIGVNGTGGEQYFFGSISNLRVVKGTAVYTSNFTPPTTPLTAISGTSLLTCQSPSLIDNSTNAFAITAYGNAKPTTLNPFGFTNTASIYSPSTFGGSSYFDGTGDYLDVGSQPLTAFGTSDFTFECWIYASAVNDTPIYESRSTSSNTDGFTVTAYSSTVIRVYTSSVLVSATVPNYLNAWTHIAFTRQGSTNRLFVNGVLGATATASDNFSNPQAFIGSGRYLNNGISAYFTGYISNLRLIKGTAIYTLAFTPPVAPVTEVANTSLLLNFTDAAVTDSSMMVNLESLGDAKITTANSRVGGSAMFFDGNGDNLSGLANPSLDMGTGNWTIECWVYISSRTLNYPAIFSNNNGSYSAGAIALTNSNADNGAYVDRFVLAVYDIATPTLVASSTNSLNTWYHLALVRNGTSLVMYRDGISVASTTISTNAVFNWGKLGCRIGGGNWDGAESYFNGYIDDLRVTKGYARYTGNFTPINSSHPLR